MKTILSTLKWISLSIAMILAGIFLSGCTTPQGESDIPWNTPQSWENGAPFDPGIMQ